MEEKLNKIYEKLLDIEIMLRREDLDKKIRECEAEENINRRTIEDLKYQRGYLSESWTEQMSSFRTTEKLTKALEE